MKIAIASQGPSFVDHLDWLDPGQYQAIIGVNALATKLRCDWWATADWSAFRKWHADVMSRPKIVMNAAQIKELREMDPTLAAEFEGWWSRDVGWMQTPKFRDGGAYWSKTSGPIALALAWRLARDSGGPCVVDCYGVDMGGTGGAAWAADASRSPERWARERFIWASLSDSMLAQGHIIRMRQPPDEHGRIWRAPDLSPLIAAYVEEIERQWVYRHPGNGEWTTRPLVAPSEARLRELLRQAPVTIRGKQTTMGQRALNVEVREVGAPEKPEK